jgi:cytochrome c peroxidase
MTERGLLASLSCPPRLRGGAFLDRLGAMFLRFYGDFQVCESKGYPDAMKRAALQFLLILASFIPVTTAIVVGVVAEEKSRSYTLQIPLGLAKDYERWIPTDNPLTPEKVELGKILFFDHRLFRNGTASCAACHDPRFGFSNAAQFSPACQGQPGCRNVPTVLNRLYSALQFWNGSAKSLEAHPAGKVVNLQNLAGYKPYFRKAFGTDEITSLRVAQAIACFERVLLSGNSAFDRFQAGEQKALPESAQRGFAVFMGKGNCSRCHVLPNFTDEQFHNIGVGMDKPNPDLGRYDVTMSQKDKGAFKTPTLREIAETYPYFHDGSAQTLEEVVEHIDKGGIPNPTLDPRIKPLGLTPVEKKDLVQFLKALTGAPLKVERPVLPE